MDVDLILSYVGPGLEMGRIPVNNLTKKGLNYIVIATLSIIAITIIFIIIKK